MVREQNGKQVHRTGRRQRAPDRLAAFWMAVLGWQPTGRYQGAVEIAGPLDSGPSLTFVPVPEAKSVKNRLHIDVNPVGCDQEQEVERRSGLGARRIDIESREMLGETVKVR